MIKSILEGKPHHFYGIVYENAIAGNYLGDASALHSANYTFLVYLVLAVINLPLYIIEKIGQFSFDKYIYIQWAKIFIVLATFITGQVMKKIGLKLGMSHKRSNWQAFAFVSSPILLFGSMAFGQTDIFSKVIKGLLRLICASPFYILLILVLMRRKHRKAIRKRFHYKNNCLTCCL